MTPVVGTAELLDWYDTRLFVQVEDPDLLGSAIFGLLGGSNSGYRSASAPRNKREDRPALACWSVSLRDCTSAC